MWDVVVYVPSARGHFKEREIIRKTWWYYVQTNKALSLRFDFYKNLGTLVALSFPVLKHKKQT